MRNHNTSTVMVMGGSGDYFEVADTVDNDGQLPAERCYNQCHAGKERVSSKQDDGSKLQISI